MGESRQARLAQTFVELADTLVNDFDVVDFLHLLARRCIELLDVAEAGLLLADPAGTLQVMASSSERARLLELFQLQNEEGPCLDSYRSGQGVMSEDLDAAVERWPRFVAEARAAGFRSVCALPLRLRSDVIGALNLFRTSPGCLSAADILTGQAMADVATIGMLQERTIRQAQVTVDHLQGALTSRVVIEQAKGLLSERAGVDMGEAFEWLRRYARNHNRHLSEVARALIDGAIESDEFLEHPASETDSRPR